MKHVPIWLMTSMLLVSPAITSAFQPGDLNCDGAINTFDIDPFVLALTDPAEYAVQFPTCDYLLADINDDGYVNAFDIDPFVVVLTSPPPTAACCYPEGDCAVTTEADCAGNWYAEWADCSVADCPQPTAACCYVEGDCAVTNEADCAGDWYADWADCSVADCPQPTAACCYPDGGCAVTTEAACMDAWHPEWADCTVAQCPQPLAACCYPDGTCTATTEAACSGVWYPEWPNCAVAQCPQPIAACCHPDGGCAVTTEADCTGLWHPEWADCSVADCPQPTAACCYPEGDCAVTTEADCAGNWYAEWADCSVADCPQPTAACCYPDGGCAVTTEADCAGYWHAEWADCSIADCPQPTAACCSPDGSCAVTTEADCFGTWHAEWVDCALAQCPQPTAVCCHPDGTCAVTTQANCTGAWHPEWADCTVAQCPQPIAACCYPEGGCAVTTEADCAGFWHAEWPDCTVAQCPQPTAACCYPDGNCAVTTEAGCTGLWHAEWADCSVAQCPQPIAACCYQDGDCSITTEAACNGAWHTEWSDCAVAQCPQPTGACCYPDGNCAVTTDADCAGTWHAEWANCSVAQCPQPTAACCYPDGDCAVTTEAGCTGLWHAEWANCSVAQCPQPTAACCYPDGNCAVTTEPGCTGLWHAEWANCSVADCPQPGAPTPAELAGNSLTAYPYFEYVRAFHQSAAIKMAIDPTLHPEIVGDTADVYIVEKKTPAQWEANPTLVDLTSGGAMAVTFSGTTIQADTFQITGPSELSAAVFQSATGANTGLGHGYDMVVDMNRNGVLDGGDYIDGLSAEAGLYVCHDTTTLGPLAVTEVLYSVGTIFGIPSTLPGEDIYYPTNIANMGQLPLLIISHGNGHNYQWYDHIGFHLASYGFVVMSHGNNTGPGSIYASLTTCGHTDAFLQRLPSIAGGVMVGHVDASRIIWCGHSRGAEGVAIAYHRILMGAGYTPTYYSADDIILVDSMLPVDFNGPSWANPHGANYHLWTASGDSDVDGSAGCDLCQTFHLHDRATNFRGSTVVQGTGHAWFHDAGGTSWFSGPCPINEAGTHLVQLGIMLPMYKHYAEGNIPGEDYLWRQYERFHPPAVPVGTDPCYVVSQEYRNGEAGGFVFIDDYETQTGTGTSSSGGAVTYNVTNLTEGRLDDNNSSFTWSSGDPFNGATQDGPSDTGKGVVFDWSGANKYYEWAVVPALQNFSTRKYLGVRGAQGTQHPYTVATAGILTFTITLRDSASHTSSINTGAYGGGFGMPYARSSGWHNEMRRIRIRMTDFLANGSPLDLTNIVAVRLDVGPSWGTNQGRIVIDEMMLDDDAPPFADGLNMAEDGENWE